jgi:superfamily II DNA or RNA helicase
VVGDSLLPFLLAGRAQALLMASAKGRAYFADGLASSFEAYRETRMGKTDVDEDAPAESLTTGTELSWYLEQLDRALPATADEAFAAHPKIRATVEKAVRLWLTGEKVLVFCHYRATGRALRRHLSARLSREIQQLAARSLPGVAPDEVMDRLDQIGKMFFDVDSDLRRSVDTALVALAGRHHGLGDLQQAKVVEVIRRFVRTPSFLARYFPIHSPESPTAFAHALDRPDESRITLRQKIDDFCRFLAERCVASERDEYLDALDTIQTGSLVGTEVEALFDPAEHNDGRSGARLANVRLVNGDSRQETRRRVLLGFNTPLFPEILVASSVLAEGVDLHLNCRYVIHHDLCWNPSTLEQRSGRVDRIGSKAEQVKDSINLFLPYVAATQDEKMYRVVRDRERWFQIVMGEKYETDELATDKQANRIELPEELRSRLSLRLHPD